ncbi:MAG TPA: cytochrome P450 [Streptosporangiaceae bacterium]|nr:cytochrome P450 [Streptosporangiaceae bacterium]
MPPTAEPALAALGQAAGRPWRRAEKDAARLVRDDMHWHGVDMKADDWILLSFPAADRGPAQFDRAGEVVIDREVNRHAAFGLGIHRCLGSHLARMELRVALQAWLERIPEFTLEDPSAVTWSAGQIRGPRTLPLRIR